MAECQISFDLQANPTTTELSLIITDSTGASLPVDVDLKPLIQQCVEQIIEQDACYRNYPTDVEFAAGPGATNPGSTATIYRVDNLPTRVCVINSDTGREAIYWILNDSNGNPQWHQSDN